MPLVPLEVEALEVEGDLAGNLKVQWRVLFKSLLGSYRLQTAVLEVHK